MKKILFLHGFYASGQCVPAVVLKEAFEGEADEVRNWYVPLAKKLLRTNMQSKIRYDKTDNIRL